MGCSRQLVATQSCWQRRCSAPAQIQCSSTAEHISSRQGCFSIVPSFPAGYLSAEAKSLVKALLEKDAGRRLGSGATGAAAVKAHPFFRRINWQALTAREVWASHAGCTRHLHAVKLMPHIASMRSRVHRLCAPA